MKEDIVQNIYSNQSYETLLNQQKYNKNKYTAKNGYNEEQFVCDDLNTNKAISDLFTSNYNVNYGICSRLKGNTKIDIYSSDYTIKAQVKKYAYNRFQQIDRHWVSDFVKYIPTLKSIEIILKNLCEYPLLPNGTHIDKSVSIKKLSPENYSFDILNNFIHIFNISKKEIIDFVFLGTNTDLQPNYLVCVEYKNNVRHKVVFLKMLDVISYLNTLDFVINKSNTVISLGNENVFSIQRKGGDSCKKSSNQMQVKVIISRLLKYVKHLEYILDY